MRVRSFEMASTITVKATPESVWIALTDARRWPEWCRACPEVSTAPDAWSPGEALSFKLRMAGIAVPFDVRLTDVEPGRRVSWVSAKFTIRAVRTITLEPLADAVLVTDHKRFSSPVIPVGAYYPQFLVRRMTESWLEDLKTEAERPGIHRKQLASDMAANSPIPPPPVDPGSAALFDRHAEPERPDAVSIQLRPLQRTRDHQRTIGRMRLQHDLDRPLRAQLRHALHKRLHYVLHRVRLIVMQDHRIRRQMFRERACALFCDGLNHA